MPVLHAANVPRQVWILILVHFGIVVPCASDRNAIVLVCIHMRFLYASVRDLSLPPVSIICTVIPLWAAHSPNRSIINGYVRWSQPYIRL